MRLPPEVSLGELEFFPHRPSPGGQLPIGGPTAKSRSRGQIGNDFYNGSI